MNSPESDARPLGRAWVFNLDWPTPPALAPFIPATFARLGPETAEPLSHAMGLADPAEVLRRFEGERRCYGAYVAGALAAYGWVSFVEEEIGELRLRVRLVPGEAYVWDCATLPAYRQKRLYTALLAHVLGELRAEGLCRAWIGADLANAASQNGIARAGFQPVADIVSAHAPTVPALGMVGRPGVPEAVVMAARRAFLGDSEQAWLEALAAAKRDPTAFNSSEI